MIVRRIRPEEYKRCQQLCALAFEYEMKDADQTPGQMVDRVRRDPRSMQDVHWDSQWAAFEDDGATMMATMTVIPWRARFDGHEVTMAGIGGVASLPQYRRGGAIRGCFEAALPHMYAGGALLSYLYPFSHAFYRKFGYELGCDWMLWRVGLSGIPAAEVGGSWRLSEPDRPLTADIRAVDRVREARYNCMVLGGDTEYLYLREDPFVTKNYTYVYYDASGRPRAHMTLAPGDGALDCKRFVFNDREGFAGLMQLLRRFAADHSHAAFAAPADVDLRGLFPEWRLDCVERSLRQRGMVRAVNAGALLGLARARGEGRLTVGIEDRQIPQNHGCFEVAFAPGTPNRVRRVDAEPDIALTIQDFSRLITGCADLDPEWLPGVRLNVPTDRAAGLFYRKPAFISAYF